MMPRTVITPTSRIVALNLHVRITESELDYVSLFVLYIDSELLRSIRSTKRLIQLDLPTIIFGFVYVEELSKT
jgi:hypothetical protein